MVLVKAPIRSRPSDRLVRVPGAEPGRQISNKAQGQCQTLSQAEPRSGNIPIMRVSTLHEAVSFLFSLS
jgi:hypothetical protein